MMLDNISLVNERHRKYNNYLIDTFYEIKIEHYLNISINMILSKFIIQSSYILYLLLHPKNEPYVKIIKKYFKNVKVMLDYYDIKYIYKNDFYYIVYDEYKSIYDENSELNKELTKFIQYLFQDYNILINEININKKLIKCKINS